LYSDAENANKIVDINYTVFQEEARGLLWSPALPHARLCPLSNSENDQGLERAVYSGLYFISSPVNAVFDLLWCHFLIKNKPFLLGLRCMKYTSLLHYITHCTCRLGSLVRCNLSIHVSYLCRRFFFFFFPTTWGSVLS
jgi:hypothetical protein